MRRLLGPPPGQRTKSGVSYGAWISGMPEANRRCPWSAAAGSEIPCQHQAPNGVGSRSPFLLSFEILFDALFRGAKRASQGNFREIVTVKAGYVLFVGAGHLLL